MSKLFRYLIYSANQMKKKMETKKTNERKMVNVDKRKKMKQIKRKERVENIDETKTNTKERKKKYKNMKGKKVNIQKGTKTELMKER